MSQKIGNPNRNTTGHFLATASAGPILILTGIGDPNTIADGNDVNAGVVSAVTGSLFLRQDGSTSTSLYVKTALPNTWTAK